MRSSQTQDGNSLGHTDHTSLHQTRDKVVIITDYHEGLLEF